MTDQPDYMVTEEVAEYIRVPAGTLRMWRTIGAGPPWSKLGRHVIYRRNDLIGWVEGQKR